MNTEQTAKSFARVFGYIEGTREFDTIVKIFCEGAEYGYKLKESETEHLKNNMTEKQQLAQMLDIKGQYKELNRRIAYTESLDENIIPSKEEDLGYWINVRKELIDGNS